jgi:hypothetical protein
MTYSMPSSSALDGFTSTVIKRPIECANFRNEPSGFPSLSCSSFFTPKDSPVGCSANWKCSFGWVPPGVGYTFTPHDLKKFKNSSAYDSASESEIVETLILGFGSAWKMGESKNDFKAPAWLVVRWRISWAFCTRSFARAASAFASSARALASAASRFASSARASASVMRTSALAFVRAAILSLVIVNAAPAISATPPEVTPIQNAIEASVSSADIEPHILPPPNLELIFGMALLCIVVVCVAISLCVWRYRRWRKIMENETNRFDRLLGAMTGPTSEKPSSTRQSSSPNDSGGCGETQTRQDTSKDASD